MPDLAQYIQNLQQQGYSLDQIKQSLLRYGYSAQMIDQVVYGLDHKKGINPLILVSLFAIIVLGLGAGYFLLAPSTPASVPGELLDVVFESVDQSVEPGSVLAPTLLLTNMGKNERFDVYVKYEVFDAQNNRVTFKSETVALQDTKSLTSQIALPQDISAGSYSLQATARYKSEVAQAQERFSVISTQAAESCSDGIKNQDEEEIDCGGSSCAACKVCPSVCDDGNAKTIGSCNAQTGFICKFEEIAVCGDNYCAQSESQSSCPDDCSTASDTTPPATNPPNTGNAQNIWEQLEQIKELAQSDPQAARAQCESVPSNFKDLCLLNVGSISESANTCDKIEDTTKKDRCFSQVAQKLDKAVLCENVQKSSRRDGCYSNFALEGDFSVCNKIENPHMKRSCNTLAQTQS